jgi:hypothetical protein
LRKEEGRDDRIIRPPHMPFPTSPPQSGREEAFIASRVPTERAGKGTATIFREVWPTIRHALAERLPAGTRKAINAWFRPEVGPGESGSENWREIDQRAYQVRVAALPVRETFRGAKGSGLGCWY